MKSISYIIDPDGDVELLLKSPNSQQLVPHILPCEGDQDDEDSEDAEDYKNSVSFKVYLEDEDGEVGEGEENDKDEEDDVDSMNEPTVTRPTLSERYFVFDDLLSPAEVERDLYPKATRISDKTIIPIDIRSVGKINSAPEARTPLEGEVRMRVSSRHLILASRFFHSMLEGPWSETSSTSSTFGKPLRLITASRWDAVAFAIVLDIIHGRHQGVPRFVDLSLMTRITSIVDYYECHEVVQVFADFWYEDICAGIEDEYSSHTLMRLFVSWVFSKQGILNAAAQIILGHMDGLSQINTKELLIDGILKIIDNKRKELIGKIVAALHDLLDTLPTSDFLCDWHKYESPTCSSIALSILVRELQSLEESDHPLAPPFHGYGVNSTIQLVNDMPESIAATTEEYDHYNDVSTCSVRARMRHVLGGVKAELNSWTLDLDKKV